MPFRLELRFASPPQLQAHLEQYLMHGGVMIPERLCSGLVVPGPEGGFELDFAVGTQRAVVTGQAVRRERLGVVIELPRELLLEAWDTLLKGRPQEGRVPLGRLLGRPPGRVLPVEERMRPGIHDERERYVPSLDSQDLPQAAITPVGYPKAEAPSARSTGPSAAPVLLDDRRLADSMVELFPDWEQDVGPDDVVAEHPIMDLGVLAAEASRSNQTPTDFGDIAVGLEEASAATALTLLPAEEPELSELLLPDAGIAASADLPDLPERIGPPPSSPTPQAPLLPASSMTTIDLSGGPEINLVLTPVLELPSDEEPASAVTPVTLASPWTVAQEMLPPEIDPGQVSEVVLGPHASATDLLHLAGDREMGQRKEVILQIIRHAHATMGLALRLLGRLPREELAALAEDPKVPRTVATWARRRLSRG